MPTSRIVSLVPSHTETLFALGLDATQLVGRTPWCIHPAEGVASIAVVGGTKTPNVRKIVRLQPDLVVMDAEENTREHYEALLEAGLEVWASHVTHVDQVPEMIEALAGALDLEDARVAGRRLANELRAALDEAARARPQLAERPRVMPLIWNEPLMGMSPHRYAGSVVEVAGLRIPNAIPGDGYPTLSSKLLGDLGVEVLLLTSEPYDFSQAEGEAIADQVAAAGFARPRAVKIDGEMLTWFGARSAAAVRYWRRIARELSDG